MTTFTKTMRLAGMCLAVGLVSGCAMQQSQVE